ncbi:MAG: SDR family oxidoreductase [Fimbriimonadales bacterium]|nr:SDR family oxidoreductase [Fimbriimonadales bacterium]
MDLGIRDRVAMVAAGTKGIGWACARALAAEGCRVAVCSRSDDNLERAAAELPGLHAHRCDVTRAEDLEAWVEAVRRDLGEPDILVTNTGGPPAGPLSQMTDEQWQAGVDATLMNVVRLMRLVAPRMSRRGWGRIVHITSLVAKEPSDLLPISSTLRAGLMALTRLQANELAPKGVTVNAVLPGHTLTDRQLHLANVRAERLGIAPSEALQRQAEEVPVRRLADPSEIAAAVAFLCSVPAAYITGVNLLVDGGLTRGLG